MAILIHAVPFFPVPDWTSALLYMACGACLLWLYQTLRKEEKR